MLTKLLPLAKIFAITVGALSFVGQALAGEKANLRAATFDVKPYVAENGRYHGFVFEIVREVYQRGGQPLDLSFAPPQRGLNQLRGGQSDLFFPIKSDKAETNDLLLSDPLFLAPTSILSLKLAQESQRTCEPLADNKNKDGPKNKKNPELTDKLGSALRDIDMVNTCRLTELDVDTYSTAYDLGSNRSPLMGKIEMKPSSQGSSPLRVAFAKGMPGAEELRQRFNRELKAFKSEPGYQTILAKYGFQDLPTGPNTLNIATVEGHDMAMIRELSKDFAAKDLKAKIHWFVMDEDLLKKRVTISLVTGASDFDIFAVDPTDVFIHARHGKIEAMNDVDVSDYFDGLTFGLSYQGKLYAAPFRSSTNVTYYRKDLFAAKKLTMPAAPTFAQLAALAGKVMDKKKEIAGICLRGNTGLNGSAIILKNLIGSGDSDGLAAMLKPDINNKIWLKIVSDYTDALKNFGPKAPETMGYLENEGLFKEGHCAIWVDATTSAPILFDPNLSKVSDKVGLVDPPYYSIPSDYRGIAVRALAVSSMSHRRELAVTFNRWLLSKKLEKDLINRYGWLHAMGYKKSIYQSKEYNKAASFAPFVYQSFGRFALPAERATQVSSDIISEFYQLWPTFSETLGWNIEGVLTGHQSNELALANTQDVVKRVIYQARQNRAKR